MMPHEDIETLEKMIQRWRSLVEHGQEMIESLETGLRAAKRAMLEGPDSGSGRSQPEPERPKRKASSKQPAPGQSKYSRPSHELAEELLAMNRKPMTAPEIQRGLKKQGHEFSVQALTHGLRKLMREDRVKKRKSRGRVTYKAVNAIAPPAGEHSGNRSP